jgi:DNA-directed RNA polymerase sigma subunit (sigma70/sigma32)
VARLHQEADIRVEGAPRTLPMLDEGITAEESLSHREERESVPQRLERLGVTERTIVLLKFGLSGEPPMTFGKIGVRLGMPTTAVHRIAASAMRKLGGQSAAHPDH